MQILLNLPEDKFWDTLPPEYRISIAEKAVSAVLRGEVYPCGTEQIELAISLAERNVDAQTISRITRLNQEVFEDFNPDK